jgi:hypothetical protein
MKLLATILLILFFSCSKQEETEKCKSVIYLYDMYEKGMLVRTDTSIVFPKVCGEELKRFESYSKEPFLVCGTGNYLRLVIK